MVIDLKENIVVPSLKIGQLSLVEKAPNGAVDSATVPTLSSCAQMHHFLSGPDNRTATNISHVAFYNHHPLYYTPVNSECITIRQRPTYLHFHILNFKSSTRFHIQTLRRSILVAVLR